MNATFLRIVIGLNILLWILIAAAVCFLTTGCCMLPTGAEVTYYVAGKTTYDGSAYDPAKFTCAVKDKAWLHHWLRFECRDKVVYCWANDLMPKDAKADFDLSPAAFMMLAPLYQGRLMDVYVDAAP